jgi:hypothetical protein
MISDKNRVFDGWLSLEGGVDAGRMPDALEINQVVSARNMSFRGGTPTTRPGWRAISEEFSGGDPDTHVPHPEKQEWCYNAPYKVGAVDRIQGEYLNPSKDGSWFSGTTTPPYFTVADHLTNENSEYIYKHGIMQCAHTYSPHNGEDCIMALIGGRLFKIIPKVNTAKVTEVIIEDQPRNLRNMKRLPMAYMCQADKWFIAQDGAGMPIIYDASRPDAPRPAGFRKNWKSPWARSWPMDRGESWLSLTTGILPLETFREAMTFLIPPTHFCFSRNAIS